MAFTVEPLQLPAPVQAAKLDWSSLNQIGDALVERRRRDAISEAQAEATDASGNLDQAKFGAALARRGLTEEARPMLALAQQQAGQAEAARHNRATETLASQKEAREANQPIVLPYGAGAMTRKGEVIREPSTEAELDDETMKHLAEQYRAGDTSVFTNLGRGAQGARNVVRLRQEIARQNGEAGTSGAGQAITNAEYFGEKAGQRTLGTKQANIEMAATEFKQVVPVVVAASNAVNRTNYPDLNRIILAWQEKTGDPNVVKFGGGLNTLVNLYARAINPTGTPTVRDKDHARGILQKAWSGGQFDAAVGMMQQEIDAALNSPAKVREEMRKRFIEGKGAPSQPTAAPANIPPPPAGFQLVR
jgi:hypothetical protein